MYSTTTRGVFTLGLLIVFVAPAQGQTISIGTERGQAARKRIETALDQPTEIAVVDSTLRGLVDMLKKKHNIPIQIDEASLAESAVGGSDFPITRELKGVSLRAVLRIVLDEVELTTIIKNEVLLVTTKERAESELETKLYVVKDLAPRRGDIESALVNNYQFLIDVLQNTTARPEDWADVGGGDGTIESIGHLGVLVISQTQDIHQEIEAVLTALRKAAAAGREVGALLPVAPGGKAKDYAKFDAPSRNAGPVIRTYRLYQPITGTAPTGLGPKNESYQPEEIVQVVTQLIEPKSWKSTDKDFAISAAGRTLIVKHLEDTHQRIHRLLSVMGALNEGGWAGGGFGVK